MMTLDELKARQNNMFGEAAVGEHLGTPEIDDDRNLQGDQLGWELRARLWYRPKIGWAKVYRIVGRLGVEDRSYADGIATFMEDAICNGFLGYSNNRRGTLLEKLLTDPTFNVNLVTENVGCDCSSLAYCAVRKVTGVAFNNEEMQGSWIAPSEDPQIPKVRNFDNYIERTLTEQGFDVEVYTIPTPTYGENWDSETQKPFKIWSSTYDTITSDYLTISNDATNSATYLETFRHLLRGDLVRTVVPSSTGHIAVWL